MFLLFLAGCVAGLASGFLGIGGGAVLIPALYFLLEEKIKTAPFLTISSVSLLSVVINTIVGGFNHYKNGNVYNSVIKNAAIGIIPGVVLGSFLASYSNEQILKIIFSLLLFISALKVLTRKEHQIASEVITQKRFPFMIMGFLGGILSPLAGVGGGIIMVPIMLTVFKLNPRKSAGTSSCLIPFIAGSSLIGRIWSGWGISYENYNFNFGYLIPEIAIPIILGMLSTVVLGAKFNRHVDKNILKYVTVATFILLSIKMFLKVI